MNKYLQNTLDEVGDNVLTFSTKDLVYRDSEGRVYDRWHIDKLVEMGYIVKHLDIVKSFVYTWKRRV